MKRKSIGLAAVLAGGLVGCAGTPGDGGVSLGGARAGSGDGPTVAYVGPRGVRLGELRGGLLATSGGAVLAEAVLDAELAERLAARGLAVDEAAVRRERELLAQTLSADPDTAARLLERLRAARGLTDDRLAALMERNAALRALVADGVDVTEEAVRLAYEREHGTRRVARVAVLATPGEADRFVRELRLGGSFEQLAMARSIDPSAGAGGLLPPISRASEGVAGSVREAVWRTAVGSVSGRVAVPEGFAVVRVERELAATGRPMAEVRGALERRVRLTGEAQAMRELAASILRGARVTVLDADLAASWSRYLEANAPAR